MVYRQNIFIGAVLVIISELMFTTMGALIKVLSADVSTEVIVFFRNLVGFILVSQFLWLHGFKTIKTRVLHLHLIRSIVGIVALYCLFYAVGHLPLAEAMLLKMTAPLFIPIVSILWLKEKISQASLIAVAAGFVGVYIILQPGGEYNIASIIGLLGGTLAAVTKTSLRKLGATEPTYRIVFYFAFIATLISAVPAFYNWQIPEQKNYIYLLMTGVTGTIAQFTLTRAYAIAHSSTVAPFTYFSVIYGSIFGYIFWQESITTSFVIGSILIAYTGFHSLIYSHLKVYKPLRSN